jgi:hypothetical protein
LSLIGYLVWIKTASPFLYKELAGRIAWASSLDRHILYARHRAEAAFLKADSHAGRPKESVAGIPTRPHESNEWMTDREPSLLRDLSNRSLTTPNELSPRLLRSTGAFLATVPTSQAHSRRKATLSQRCQDTHYCDMVLPPEVGRNLISAWFAE